MKKTLFAAGMVLSSMAFADVDYSRCMMASGAWAQIDNDGKIKFSDFQKVKSQKTEGNKETYVIEMPNYYGSTATTTHEVTYERDDQGHIVKVSTGGDKMDPKNLKQYKDGIVNSSVFMGTSAQYMGGYAGGYAGGIAGGYAANGQQKYQSPEFMYSEPQFWVDDKIVPLSKLSKDQAKKVGFEGNIEELQKAKQQWRKDKKVLKKIKDGYSKITEKAPLVVPMGQETEFEIKDGVCLVKNISQKTYNTKTKEVTKHPGISREKCEEIQNIRKKYATKLNECQDVQMKMNSEFFQKGIYDQGYGMGMYGGYVGGFGGGMVGGYGLGMGGYSSFHCESLYGVGQVQFSDGTVAGSQSGSGSSSGSQAGATAGSNDASKQ